MAKYLVNGISYDTDGENVDLPKSLEIELPSTIINEEEIESKLSDEISNITGFCHFGFTYKPL